MEESAIEKKGTLFKLVWRYFVWLLPVAVALALSIACSYFAIDDEGQSVAWIVSVGLASICLLGMAGAVSLIGTLLSWHLARHFCALLLSLGSLILCVITLSSYVGKSNWGAPLHYPLFLELLMDVKFVFQLARQNLLYTGAVIAFLLTIYWWFVARFPYDAKGWPHRPRKLLFILTTAAALVLFAAISFLLGHSESPLLQNEIYSNFLSEPKPLQRKKGLALGVENLIHPAIDKSKLDPKNVVIISVDCLRADHLSHRGYARETTPFLDSLHNADQIASFELTTSTCNSSFCGILSILNGATYHDLSYFKFGLHDYLKKAGYRTNFYLSGVHRNWYNLRKHYGNNIDNYLEGADVEGFSSYDDFFIPEVLGKLPDHDEPNFFFFHLMGPHVLGKKHESFEIFQPTVPHNLARRLRINRDSPDSKNAYRNNFDNGIYQTDHVIKQIFDVLSHKGYLDDAIIVIVGDHGESMGENQLSLGHGSSLRQNGLLVPILFIEPEAQVYREKKYATQIDIAPTIADRLGLEVPASWRGVSLIDTHEERITYHEQSGFGEDRQLLALIDKQPDSIYKYILDLPLGKEFFFNLTNDPLEKNPITITAAQKSYYSQLLHNYKDGVLQKIDSAAYVDAASKSITAEDSLYLFRLRDNSNEAITKSLFETNFGSRRELTLVQFDFSSRNRMQFDFLWLAETEQQELRINVHLSQPNQRLFNNIARRGKFKKLAGAVEPAVFATANRSSYIFKVGADLVVTIAAFEKDEPFQEKLVEEFIPSLHDRLEGQSN